MTILLDTHILLWALADPEQLGDERRDLIEDPTNSVLVSAVSVAEVAIKASVGKLGFDGNLVALAEEAGFEWISFSPSEAMRLQALPFRNRDPFDRMLVCQALEREIPIVTDDQKIPQYDCPTL